MLFSYELMCKCWKQEPTDRPCFSEIAEFLGNVLKSKPPAGSQCTAEYDYSRLATKDIPDDYLDVNQVLDDSNRIKVETNPSKPLASVKETVLSKPSERSHLPARPTNGYFNT